MKDWQFYLALLIFIILFNVKVKEGNYDIPERAEVFNKPIDLIHTVTNLIDDKKTSDMIEQENLQYELKASQKFHNETKQILDQDIDSLNTCKRNLASLKETNANLSSQYTVCNTNLGIETQKYSKCKFQDLPKAWNENVGTYTTWRNLIPIRDNCYATLAAEKQAVKGCENEETRLNNS